MRKTIKITELLEVANNALANSTDEMVEHRHSVAFIVEQLLHKADAYRGFSYLPGTGITFENNEPVFHDDSRRLYHGVSA